jgi:serine/threonine-protein kinase RsbW
LKVVVQLRFPGRLEYRDLALRAVAAATKLAGGGSAFDAEVVSAFGEAFNNVALHAYRGRPSGDVEIEIDIAPDCVTVRLADFGESFDVTAVPDPDLDEMPESGLGLYILRSCVDEIAYHAGPRNVLCMTKRLPQHGAACGGVGLR